jgi:outer membrane lipoprotein-sorting protein
MDKYRIHLVIDKLTVNQPLADETFELKIPEGMQVQRMQ